MDTNKTRNYELTIIVPVYNEEDNIIALEKRLSVFIHDARYAACVLFVDDGSTDRSRELIAEACCRHTAFFHIVLDKNCGQSAALKAGIDAADSPYVGYMDADLQTAPEDFNRLMPYAKDYEMVTGIRLDSKDTAFNKLLSKAANAFNRMVTHDGIQDEGCPLKIMRTACAQRMPLSNGMHRFMPALVLLQGGRVRQIPVRHFRRIGGVSKYNFGNRLVILLEGCFAYIKIKLRVND